MLKHSPDPAELIMKKLLTVSLLLAFTVASAAIVGAPADGANDTIACGGTKPKPKPKPDARPKPKPKPDKPVV
jgi:hypothetical protein